MNMTHRVGFWNLSFFGFGHGEIPPCARNTHLKDTSNEHFHNIRRTSAQSLLPTPLNTGNTQTWTRSKTCANYDLRHGFEGLAPGLHGASNGRLCRGFCYTFCILLRHAAVSTASIALASARQMELMESRPRRNAARRALLYDNRIG